MFLSKNRRTITKRANTSICDYNEVPKYKETFIKILVKPLEIPLLIEYFCSYSFLNSNEVLNFHWMCKLLHRLDSPSHSEDKQNNYCMLFLVTFYVKQINFFYQSLKFLLFSKQQKNGPKYTRATSIHP